MSTAKGPRKLACVLCRHRKLKCDHNTPCSNCIKPAVPFLTLFTPPDALKAKVSCTPRAPAPARKRRLVKKDLQARLAQLETLLKQHTGTDQLPAGLGVSAHDSEGQKSRPESLDSTPESTRTHSPAHMSEIGRMLKDDAGVRFVDSYTLAAILENLSELRAIIETESLNENGMTPLKEATPESDLEPLQNSVKVSSNHVHELQPEPGLAIRLWHLYLERVNPLLKITHIPTLQPAVMKAAGSLQNTPLEYQALLFAIYIIGAISISHDEAHHMIGMPRDDAIERFTKGLKIVLVQLDFVKNYNMVVLQALVLYATALQGRYDRHAAWVLNGTVLRIAQKMGYHRDGEALNLPPFETEMRRRIWWQIISNDVKYALFSGLNRSLFPVHWDTKRPSNLNDADMYPGLTAPAKDRNGPTEMAYVLITTEITKSLGRIAKNPGFDAAILGRSRDYARGNEALEAANMEEYQAIVRDLDVNVQEIERRFVDRSAGKVHEAALIIRQLIISKALEMLGAGDPAVHTPQDRLMRILVNNLEDACAWQTSMAKYGFRWAPQMHFNAEVLTLLTILLAETPDAPIAHRAWDAIEACYREQLGLHNTAHKVYHEQAILTLRAWQTRKSIEPSGASRTLVQEPGFISNLKATVQTYDSKSCSSFSSPDYAPNVINPLSQATELDALLGGYFDLSLFQQRDACHTEPPVSPGMHAMPVPDLVNPRFAQGSHDMMLNMSSQGASQWQRGLASAEVDPVNAGGVFLIPDLVENRQPRGDRLEIEGTR